MATIEEFEGWLKKGLGRAVLHLRTHDSSLYLNSLLHACTHNLAYDSQCESTREEYLKDLIRASRNEEFFRVRLFDLLIQEDFDLDSFDLDQTIAVARMFAERGDLLIKDAMYAAVKRAGFEKAGSCYSELIALDGMMALRVAAEECPESLQDCDAWIINELLHALEERNGLEAAQAAIKDAAPDCPELKMFVQRCAETRDTKPHNNESVRMDYASLKASIQTARKIQILSPWGKSASADELQAAADDLNVETDHQRLVTYLSIFRKVSFPGPIDRLLEIAEDSDARCAQGAIRILSQINDPRVRSLLLKFLDIENRRGDALELMISNFAEGDFQRIEKALQKTREEDSLHSLGMGLRHLVSTRLSPDAVESLIFLYENGPCSLCRGEVVKKLNALGSIPNWMRAECAYDADPEIRELVTA